MKKPEIMATAGSMDDLRGVIQAGADAVLIGNSRWGTRLPGDFSYSQTAEAASYARSRGAKVYYAMNNLIANGELEELADHITEIANVGIDAIVFGDPAVYMVCQQLAPRMELHWNAEMTTTNYEAANFWASKGVSRAVLARELNMEQVLDFKQHANMGVQVQVHGATNIYHSRRDLIQSYLEHREAGPSTRSGALGGLYLVEAERPELSHPIYEDRNGTHIMSADDICMLDALDELMAGGIDSFKIEGLLKSTQYNETVVKAYRAAVDAYVSSPENYSPDPDWLLSIRKLQDPRRELTFGFFYKEQVY